MYTKKLNSKQKLVINTTPLSAVQPDESRLTFRGNISHPYSVLFITTAVRTSNHTEINLYNIVTYFCVCMTTDGIWIREWIC
jgi:hypothetical protein